MRVYSVFNLFIALVLLSSEAVQAVAHSWREEDSRPGYSENLKPENDEVGEILYAVDSPYKNEVHYNDRIFDPTLKKDVTQRYREKFGRTEAEIIQSRTPYLNSNFSEGASITFNEQEYQAQQKSFGNYVAKRVVEYHFEKEAKDNPSLRGVYEAKQTVENASASVGQFKVRARYRIASNSILAYIKNPYVNLEGRFEMSGEKETVLSVSRDLGQGYSLLTDYYFVNTRWDWIGRKTITPALSVSLTYSPYRDMWVTQGVRGVEISERLIIGGLGYVF